METKTIGEKIHELRETRGITQTELGAKLNVSYQMVSKWENGEVCPDFSTMSKIAQYFGVSITYFEESIKQEESVKQAVTKPAPLEKTMVCPFCGKETRVGKFCEHCDGYLGIKNENTAVVKEKKTIEGIICNGCGRKIPANSLLCPYCRNIVGTVKINQTRTSSVTQGSASMSICGDCGRAYSKSLTRCPICGRKNDFVHSVSHSDGSVNFWAIIAFICSLAVSGIAGLIFACIADKNAWKYEKPMYGMTTAAKILSIILIVLSVLCVILYLTVLSDLMPYYTYYS